jgi:hypothetical protein
MINWHYIPGLDLLSFTQDETERRFSANMYSQHDNEVETDRTQPMYQRGPSLIKYFPRPSPLCKSIVTSMLD